MSTLKKTHLIKISHKKPESMFSISELTRKRLYNRNFYFGIKRQMYIFLRF